MFITWVYQGIILMFSIVLVWEILTEKAFRKQLTAVIVLVPMLLRLFMIK